MTGFVSLDTFIVFDNFFFVQIYKIVLFMFLTEIHYKNMSTRLYLDVGYY